jgi:hypothetical protein
MGLVTDYESKLIATYTGTGDLTNPVADLRLDDHFVLASGTGTSQADKIYQKTTTLSASGTADLDLAGSLTDILGTALTFVKIKLIRVTASSANTNNVQITRPASNGVPFFLAAGDGLSVLPGGYFGWCAPGAGITVTAATGDLLTFTNSAGSTSVTYSVVIIGTSA